MSSRPQSVVERSLHHLPVMDVVRPLGRALGDQGAAVLCAPPGSGKTTAIPLCLLDETWLKGRGIVMLEPRRVAARAAARRMAALLGEEVGETVGYQVRFDRRAGPRTRIEVVTEGILTRRLQADPAMADVGLVIFDEFHERNLQADLALALCLDARTAFCEHLRVLVMSATLDSGPVASVLGEVPIVTAAGQTHPVEVRHEPRPVDASKPAAVVRAIGQALETQSGDVLVFLPGVREILAVAQGLEPAHSAAGRDSPRGGSAFSICPLYGDLPAREQDRAIVPDPAGHRRVVLATNIAETSLTIEGVGAVVDSGLARRSFFDPNTGLSRLTTVAVSRASATQRAGRAGRTGPGICFRLWTEAEHSLRAAHESPDLLSADLSGMMLELAAWGVDDLAALRWVDRPPAGHCAQARDLLRQLGALNEAGLITALGEAMAKLPTHPRLAAMLLAANGPAEQSLACDLAALLDSPDIIPRADRLGAGLVERVEALHRWRRKHGGSVNERACRQVQRGAEQLRRRLGLKPHPDGRSGEALDASGRLLLAAYPDRLAQRREPEQSNAYRLASGRVAALQADDRLIGSEYLVVADLDAGRSMGRIYRAAGLAAAEVETLAEHAGRIERRVRWARGDQAVEACTVTLLGAIELARKPLTDADPEEVLGAMLDGVRELGLGALPWTDALSDLRVRVQCLAHWQPQAGWPAFDEQALLDDLADWLGPFLHGVRRRSHLRSVNLEAALRAAIPPRLMQGIDVGAPARMKVASGSEIRLRYTPGEAPVLAVKLQEMFGTRATPTVCWGEVPVTVHLLSPAGHPVQVTQDLAEFWRGSYQAVRKDLRGRYPKHPWPEDPTDAVATRLTTRALKARQARS